MSYYSSAEEMAGDLSLGALLLADPDPRILRRHDRLSGYAVDPAHGSRLYNLVKSAVTRQGAGAGLAGKVLWIAAPWGSLHHLPWVVGLAEHAARDGLVALLADSEESGPLAMLAEGGGRPIAGLALPEQFAAGPLQACSTDLEGVSVVRRGSPEVSSRPLALESKPWCLLRADALPESLDGPYPEAVGTDGVILVAPFRDHSREELTAVVRGLRSAGHRILGFIAIGPRAQAAAPMVPCSAGVARPGSDDGVEAAAPADAGEARDPAPSDAGEACREAPGSDDGVEEAAPADLGEARTTAPSDAGEAPDSAPEDTADGRRAAPLIASWNRRTGSRRSRWPAAVLLTVLILAVPGVFFLRDHLSRPSHTAREAGESASPPPTALDDAPWTSKVKPIASGIAGEDLLEPSEHDDTYWDFLDGLGPGEAQEQEEIDPGFGVAYPPGGEGDKDAADPDGGGFVVHLSSFRLRSEADREVANLAGMGMDARHIAVVIPGKGLRSWYRVVTGRSATFAEAESLALVLISEGKIPNAHVAGDGGHGDPVPVATPD